MFPVEKRVVHVTWRRPDPPEKRCKGQKTAGPIVVHSVLLMTSSGEVASKGLAICSPTQTPKDSFGYEAALGRAKKALRPAWVPKDSHRVVRPEALVTLESAGLAKDDGNIGIGVVGGRTRVYPIDAPSAYSRKIFLRPQFNELSLEEWEAVKDWRGRNVPQQAAVG